MRKPEFLLLLSAVFMANSMPAWMASGFGWLFLVWVVWDLWRAK